MIFEKVQAVYDDNGRRKLVPTGEPDAHFECDDVLIAVGQENAFPWIERDSGIEFDEWGMPLVDKKTLQSSLPNVFFGGDAALRPEEHHLGGRPWPRCRDLHRQVPATARTSRERPPPMVTLVSQKMGIHEWSYDNEIVARHPLQGAVARHEQALKNIKVEVELGFDPQTAWKEAQRCLNCDVQTVFATKLCIECDACVDICPMDCITFTANGDEDDLRQRLTRAGAAT